MEEWKSCPCAGATLDRLIQPAILTVLAAGPLHGYCIADRIAALPGFGQRRPDVSGIYRFLRAMERRGLVVAAWDLSASGPAKRCYELTTAGRQCLRQWVKTLEVYRAGVDALLEAASAEVPKRRARKAQTRMQDA